MPTNPSRVAEVQALAEQCVLYVQQNMPVPTGLAMLLVAASKQLSQCAAHLAEPPDTILLELKTLRAHRDRLQAQADRQAQELEDVRRKLSWHERAATFRRGHLLERAEKAEAERDRQAQTLASVQAFCEQPWVTVVEGTAIALNFHRDQLLKLLADGGA